MLMKGRLNANLMAYLAAFSESRSATITLVCSLKMAPLRRRWLYRFLFLSICLAGRP
jgi:hypothetical protein